MMIAPQDIAKINALKGDLKILDNGETLVTFGSIRINQHIIDLISNIKHLNGVLFYFSSFSDLDLSVLKNSNLNLIAIMHGNFSDRELLQLNKIERLKTLKLYDTKVTDSEQQKFILNNKHVNVI